ncbi:MAG: ATP--guanido phosphotransferase [Clostridia bacterium]|nr:ATP--guanido phosphotransferase [Clostridia bacterium]
MAWYQVKGNNEDTVISSRIRFARNLQGYPFGKGLSPEKANEIISMIEQALEGLDFLKTDMNALSPTAARALAEQHLISPNFAAATGPRALFRADGKSLSLMALEEDHIRLQCILPGLSLYDAYRLAAACDDRLDEKLPIAFDEELGYLTRCPTNLGTGMRASVMLFLPALTDAGYIPSLAEQLAKLGLTMRGTFGEGSAAHGALYQISNQVTLGVSEEDILHKLTETVENIIGKERRLRKAVTGEAALLREDRISRAEGTLRYARRLTSEELFSLYRDLKQGIALGIVTDITSETLNALLIAAMPAMLTEHSGEHPQTPAARDALRAKFIKQALEVKTHE